MRYTPPQPSPNSLLGYAIARWVFPYLRRFVNKTTENSNFSTLVINGYK
ncbi:MAG: protein-export chaperone SecB [Desmonostoc geniculatum HA4340-LM1]|nr:protein-export chaperone SecB [Desmonostoc geniculatum HA4340-LM1]